MASKVHRVRFYKPKPQAINCVSFNKKLGDIALARADASIEVWDLKQAPYLVKFIPGVENGSVEALGWVGSRLLSTGLGGALVEWDLTKLVQKTSVLLTGYAAWCLDVNNIESHVAVGTEQGYINLYSVENDDIVYTKLFDKQDGRVMCCKFDSTGNILVTGSIDTIRVWNVETGHAMTRISVSRRKKEVIVWCIAVLSDKTIVSGDSHGRLTFWDSTHGEQIESFTTHKADVLSIAVSEDEHSLYCSGMDPIITHFVKVTKGRQASQSQWVKNVQRHIHEHDVRSLVIKGNVLISTGVDGYLTFSSYPPKWVMRIPPITPTPRSSLCPQKKLLILRYSDHVDVWKLGSYDLKGGHEITKVEQNGLQEKQDPHALEQDSTIAAMNGLTKTYDKKRLNITDNPLKLVSINTKKGKQIQCCELSPSGEFIIYATASDVRLLKLETDDSEDDQSNISLSKVIITGLPGPCTRVAFTEDSRTIIACCDSQELYVLHADPEAGATVLYSVDISKGKPRPSSILHLLVSKQCKSGTTYVVVSDSCSMIQVLSNNNKKKKFSNYTLLPKYKFVPTAMTVDPERETLIVIYSNQRILEFDLVNKKVMGWDARSMPRIWHNRTAAVESVTVHPRRDALVIQDGTSLWILGRTAQEENEEPNAKKNPDFVKQVMVKVIPVKYLAGFHWLEDDEAVMVEVPPENIVSQLPAPVQVSSWQGRP